MDTIINYLESMFLKLPNSKEVQKAKRELLQMMTDKYNELKAEGKSENEAVAIVISEFGNIDEIADDIGIKDVVEETADENRRIVTLNEANEYLKESKESGFKVGLGVVLCILSPVGWMIFGDLISKRSVVTSGTLGLLWLALFITGAVILFTLNGNTNSKWAFLKNELCSIEYGTAKELQKTYENHKTMRAIYISGGVLCCFFAAVFAGFIDDIFTHVDFSGVVFFCFIALGVFLFVYCGKITGAYNTLLTINDKNTVGGNFVGGQQEVGELSGTAATVMSCFWPTITCIYLAWSFLTFDWHITWIIWPLAALIRAILVAVFQNNKSDNL